MTITSDPDLPDTVGRDWGPADWLARILEGPLDPDELAVLADMLGSRLADAINEAAEQVAGAREDVESSAGSMAEMVDWHLPRGTRFRREWAAELQPNEVAEKGARFASRVARLDALRESLRTLAGATLGVER